MDREVKEFLSFLEKMNMMDESAFKFMLSPDGLKCVRQREVAEVTEAVRGGYEPKGPEVKKTVPEKAFSHYEITVFGLNGNTVHDAFEYDVDEDYLVIIPVRGIKDGNDNRELDEFLYPRENIMSVKVVKVFSPVN